MVFLIRWGFTFVLLALTYNSTNWTYVRWAMENYTTEAPMVLLLGLLFLVGYIIYLRATLCSIGTFGMILVLAIVGALLWVLYDWGLLSLENQSQLVWIGLLTLSIVLGIGLSWSHIRRAISGQSDMDDVGE